QEVQRAAGQQFLLPRRACGQQLRPPSTELPLERGDQAERVRGEDLAVPVPVGSRDLDALASRHVRSFLSQSLTTTSPQAVEPTLAGRPGAGQRKAERLPARWTPDSGHTFPARGGPCHDPAGGRMTRCGVPAEAGCRGVGATGADAAGTTWAGGVFIEVNPAEGHDTIDQPRPGGQQTGEGVARAGAGDARRADGPEAAMTTFPTGRTDGPADGRPKPATGRGQAGQLSPAGDRTGDLDLADRQALRRVAGLSTELQDITEVEYRALRLEQVVLVGVWTEGTLVTAENSLRELSRLAETAGSVVLDGLVQRRSKPDPATYIGGGKAAELAALVTATGADTVICDGELTPGQLRSLEGVVRVKVIDRTALILDIFAQHAHSKEGKAQVELAQLEYLVPRLRGWGENLARQAGGRVAAGGGIGGRGPGETKLETDRRRIRTRMAKLRREIE